MTDREKVIKGLETCVNHQNTGFGEIGCSHSGCLMIENGNCIIDIMPEIIALLKAQEPRVMTLEEVKQHNNQDGCVWFEQPTYNAVAAFVRKDEFEIEVISPYILGEPINHGYWLSSNYNVTWRCWTSRPDQATREATPWN